MRLPFFMTRQLGLLWLCCLPLVASAQSSDQLQGSFWERHLDAIVVAVIIIVLGKVFGERINQLLASIGEGLRKQLHALGWRFKKRYLAALSEKHQWLRLIGIFNRAHLHPPRLREVYVSLRLAAGEAATSPGFSWNQVFSIEQKRLVILGPPGSGKTTLLHYLVLVFTGVVTHTLRAQLGSPFPMIGRLRELGGEGGPAALTELLSRCCPVSGAPKGFFERRLRRGGCIVLLDGLDEVLDSELHQRVVGEIEKLVSDYPENIFVITCRVAGWRSQLPGFRTYEIQELSSDNIRQFIGAWYREVLRTQKVNLLGASPAPEAVKQAEGQALEEAGKRTEMLWKALSANQGLLRISRTPLILSLITLVHYHRYADLPKGRSRLYQQCLEILLEIWDLKEKHLGLAGPSLNEKLMVLRAIAFHYLEQDLLEAELPVIEQVVTPLLPRINTPVGATELIRQIWERSGILVELAIGWYGFAHRALHDYLAAAYVVEKERDDILVEHAGEERWQEVTLIAVGLAPEKRACRLVSSFLEDEREEAAGLEMAGLSLAEDVQLGDDLRGKIRQRLLTRLGQEQAAGPFARLASALMAADLKTATGWMEQALRGSDQELQLRVLGLLGELDREHAGPFIPILLKVIADPDEAATVRARAAAAMAGIDVELDGAGWQVLKAARQDSDDSVKAAATWAWCELGRYQELGLVKVPEGEFMMGSDDGFDDEKPQHVLYLPDFYIGRHTVTVTEFREYIKASGNQPGVADCLDGPLNHPVVWISWHEALAYARWYGYTLPSEAEWEKAARGTDGRRYPWGNEWRQGHANTAEYWSDGHTRKSIIHRFLRRRGPEQGTTEIGRFSPLGDSPYGCTDMAGNVWEWTRSIWGKDWREPESVYPYQAHDGREDESSDLLRVLRGGAFCGSHRYARCSCRYGYEPDGRDLDVGFRVVVLPFSSDL
jgi:formylglycine-generating enzyme required for sulfatase activity/energy-coupling factor transporter ATP-binding protein EcfA2